MVRKSIIIGRLRSKHITEDVMKIRWFVLLVLLAVVVSAGCQSSSRSPATAPGGPANTQSPASPRQNYPAPVVTTAPAQGYPGPSAPVATGAYPGPSGAPAAQVSWEEATKLIQGGTVTQIQIQGMQVTLTLKNGTTTSTTQPESGAVATLIQTCGDPCKSISVSGQ